MKKDVSFLWFYIIKCNFKSIVWYYLIGPDIPVFILQYTSLKSFRLKKVLKTQLLMRHSTLLWWKYSVSCLMIIKQKIYLNYKDLMGYFIVLLRLDLFSNSRQTQRTKSMYILKWGMNWNHLEHAGMSWNHLEWVRTN